MQAGKNNIRKRSAVIAVGILALAVFIGVVFVQRVVPWQKACTAISVIRWDVTGNDVVCYGENAPITGIIWDSTVSRFADGSDNWPMTWADDGDLYTAYGDGWGFVPKVPNKLSLGFAKVSGNPHAHIGANIASDGEQTGGGASGKKASGLLMLDSRLWMWVRNANEDGEECELWYSDDYSVSWIDAGWNFTELGYCAFINFGKDYAGARDNYVYTTSPDTNSAYDETDDLILLRVPKDEQAIQASYEYFTGTVGNPTWGAYADRQPILSEAGAINRHDITFNAPLGRYIMTMRARAQVGGLNHFSLYEAPEPWGPWTLFYRDLSPTNWGESQRIPSKWISADGLDIYLVFSGNDAFSVRGATLIVG